MFPGIHPFLVSPNPLLMVALAAVFAGLFISAGIVGYLVERNLKNIS